VNILLIVSNVLTVVSIIVSLAQIALALRIFQTATRGGGNRLLSCLFSCLRAGQNLDICNVRVGWNSVSPLLARESENRTFVWWLGVADNGLAGWG